MSNDPRACNVYTRQSPFRDQEGRFLAPAGYTVYHGTAPTNVAAILATGLRAAGSDAYEVVCFTEDPDVCEDFGDATIAADLSGLTVDRFWDEGDGDGVWEVQTSGPVAPQRLKLMPGG